MTPTCDNLSQLLSYKPLVESPTVELGHARADKSMLVELVE